MRLWILLLILFTSTAQAQYKDGIVVVQYSADFVKAAEVNLDDLDGADQFRFYLTDHPQIFKKDKDFSISFTPFTRTPLALFLVNTIPSPLTDSVIVISLYF